MLEQTSMSASSIHRFEWMGIDYELVCGLADFQNQLTEEFQM